MKREAESILADMGIPASVGINMFYHQIIYCHGLLFRPVVPKKTLPSLDDMTRDEFDARMAAGLADAKTGKGLDVDDAFDQLIAGTPVKGAVNG